MMIDLTTLMQLELWRSDAIDAMNALVLLPADRLNLELKFANFYNNLIQQTPQPPMYISEPATTKLCPNSRTSTVPASITSVQLIAAASDRGCGGNVFNKSVANLWVSLGATAATTASPSIEILAGQYMTIPEGYSGAIQGIWDATDASGFVQAVEFIY